LPTAFKLAAPESEMQCVYMPQIVLALGADAHGNVTNLYTGGSQVDAKATVDAVGETGAIIRLRLI
jgi:hypothetical protein